MVKFLRSDIDTHGIPESIRSDHILGFKEKTLKNFALNLISNENSVRWVIIGVVVQ